MEITGGGGGGGGSGGVRYVIAQSAYVKLVLHALKYSHQAVNGTLVGRVVPASSGDKKATTTTTVELLDAVDEHFTRNERLSIVGYYHANERADDVELGATAQKIGDRVYNNNDAACILLVDNRRLSTVDSAKPSQLAVQLYTRERGRKWELQPQGPVVKEGSAGSVLANYIQERRYARLVDFDDHLDDIARDWLNSTLLS
eukprot:jgi/Chlat1/8564/Chrsp82S07954